MALTAAKTYLGTTLISACNTVKFASSQVLRMFLGEALIFPSAVFSLLSIKYNNTSAASLCGGTGTASNLYWVDCSTLDVGDYVWTDSGRTTLAAAGWYGTGTGGSIYYYVNPAGIVNLIGFCPTPTPTPTPTRTPTPTPTIFWTGYNLYVTPDTVCEYGTNITAYKYNSGGSLEVGNTLYASQNLGDPLTSGFYTDGSFRYTVQAGGGISAKNTCPAPTPTPTVTPTPTRTPTPTPTPTANPCPCQSGFGIGVNPTISCDDNSGLNGRVNVAFQSLSCNSYQVRLLAISGGTTTGWTSGAFGIGTNIFTFTGIDDGTYNAQIADSGKPECAVSGPNIVVNCYVAPTATPTPTPTRTPTPTPTPTYYYYALSTCWGQSTSISVGRSTSSSYGTAVFLIGGICFQSNGITSGPSYDVDLDSYSFISGGCSDASCNPPTPTPTPTPTSTPTPTPAPTCYTWYNYNGYDIYIDFVDCGGTTQNGYFVYDGGSVCAQIMYSSTMTNSFAFC